MEHCGIGKADFSYEVGLVFCTVPVTSEGGAVYWGFAGSVLDRDAVNSVEDYRLLREQAIADALGLMGAQPIYAGGYKEAAAAESAAKEVEEAAVRVAYKSTLPLTKDGVLCSDCRKPIGPYTAGTVVRSAAQVAELSAKRWKVPVCVACSSLRVKSAGAR